MIRMINLSILLAVFVSCVENKEEVNYSTDLNELNEIIDLGKFGEIDSVKWAITDRGNDNLGPSDKVLQVIFYSSGFEINQFSIVTEPRVIEKQFYYPWIANELEDFLINTDYGFEINSERVFEFSDELSGGYSSGFMFIPEPNILYLQISTK
ncbi:MAG: hypothetical protein H6598_10265 [Flavobacteriales bacterium]|nr:hypothetical protein [Flavobacteriales bacterium]